MATATLKRKAPISKTPEPGTLASVNVSARDANFTLKVDTAALFKPYARSDETIMLLSAAGSHTSIKSLRAALSGGYSKIRLSDCEFPGWRHDRDRTGYSFYAHRLGSFSWQLLAISKSAGFMPVYNDSALYRELRSDKYTTPILQAWMPSLGRLLTEAELLFPLHCYNCNAAYLTCPPDSLDEIVSNGLRDGILEIA